MFPITGRVLAVVALSVVVSACHKKQKPAPPPPPVVLPKTKKTEPPPNLPAPPVIQTPKKETTTAPPVAVEVSPPPPPKPATKKQRRPPKKAADIKAENRPPDLRIEPGTPTPGAKPDAEPPKPPVIGLGEILTPEQIREYNRRIEAALNSSKRALLLIQSKSLDNAQQQLVGRISGFITQAEQTRAQDLATATSLAERADLLAKDLLSRLR